MLDRKEFADKYRARYYNWLRNVLDSPHSGMDKVEFAIISAHTPMSAAIDGFLATRHDCDSQEYADTLNDNGVLASYAKTAHVWESRELIIDGMPLPDGSQEHRETHKLPGLGICKSSFAACLINPLESQVVCLDTHMLQVLMERRPTKQEVSRVYRRLDVYSELEDQLRIEAHEVDMPVFAYQWAVWDWKRLWSDHKTPEDHSFLWESGRSTYQLPMFSGMEMKT